MAADSSAAHASSNIRMVDGSLDGATGVASRRSRRAGKTRYESPSPGRMSGDRHPDSECRSSTSRRAAASASRPLKVPSASWCPIAPPKIRRARSSGVVPDFSMASSGAPRRADGVSTNRLQRANLLDVQLTGQHVPEVLARARPAEAALQSQRHAEALLPERSHSGSVSGDAANGAGLSA